MYYRFKCASAWDSSFCRLEHLEVNSVHLMLVRHFCSSFKDLYQLLLGTFILPWFWGCLLQSQDHPGQPCLVNYKGAEKQEGKCQRCPLVWSASYLQAECRGRWRAQKGKTPVMLQPAVQLGHWVNEWNFKQRKSYLMPDNESSPSLIFRINMIIFALTKSLSVEEGLSHDMTTVCLGN